MKELEITKGLSEVENVFTHNGDFYKVKIEGGESICNITTRNPERALNNAELIADAFNTSNQCNLLPSELLKQRDELLSALEVVKNNYTHFGNDSSKRKICRLTQMEISIIEKAINQIK